MFEEVFQSSEKKCYINTGYDIINTGLHPAL